MISSVKMRAVKEIALMWMNSSSNRRNDPIMMTLPGKINNKHHGQVLINQIN